MISLFPNTVSHHLWNTIRRRQFSMSRLPQDVYCVNFRIEWRFLALLDFTIFLSNFELLQIARPDSSQNFMYTAKTINLIRLCIQINNIVVFSNHTHIKFIKKSKTENMSTLSNIMFRISWFRTTVIHRRTERLGK